MATAKGDFHIILNGTAREGKYQVRLYSVPNTMLVTMAGNAFGADHWTYANQTKPTILNDGVLDSIAPLQIDAENEFEQGVPRYASMQVDCLGDPALQIVIEGIRDTTKSIWCEITLTQPINDAPDRPANASLVWPVKEKLYFWGFIDRKSSKGTAAGQHLIPGTAIRQDNRHDGSFSFVFLPWITWSSFIDVANGIDVKSVCDWLRAAGADVTPFAAGVKHQNCAQILLTLLRAISPTHSIYIADQQMNPAQYYAGTSYADVSIDPANMRWGKMSVSIGASNGTLWRMLHEVFCDNGGLGLFSYDGTVQTHKLTSDQESTSIYHWNDFAQAITEWCREFFFTWQVELPTLAQAAAAYAGLGFEEDPPDNSTTFQGSARFLLLDIATSPKTGNPLTITINPLDKIEYYPCGAWASSYTVNEPTSDGLLPDPAQSVATSAFVGGSDETYSTMLRFCGYSVSSGSNAFDARGWEIYVKNSHGDYALGQIAIDMVSNNSWNEVLPVGVTPTPCAWSSCHAYKKISRWGMPRAIINCTSRGVGLEPFGASASVGGTAITAPVKTFGLNDFSDFALGRFALSLPGILASPGDERLAHNLERAIGFQTISVKRTPGGDTELKLIEVLGADSSYQVPPPDAVTLPTPLPSLPPSKGGPPDGGPINITGL